MDFDQKKISKIHDFCMDFDFMSDRLRSLNKMYPTGLIVPVKGDDLRSPVFGKMISEMNECDYLRKVYIALSAVNPEDYSEAMYVCGSLKIPCDVVWCNKPEVISVLEGLKKKGLDVTGMTGKGKDLWLTMGIASLDLYAFVVHDADIAYYSKTLPTKMLYPVIEPRLDFFFAKGYYARVNVESKKMYGRICRLFIDPLLETLQEKLMHYSRFLTYLQSFSYALSGEFTIYSDLAKHLRISSDWGFEVGLLAELFRNASYRRICEVDLGFYDHKHKQVTPLELLRTAEDSFVTLLRTLTEMDGIEVTEPFLRSLLVMYRRTAQDKIRQYHADATCNNIEFDRHQEESDVDALTGVIASAGKKFLEAPVKTQLPDWLRTISAMPDIRERLKETAIAN